MKHLLNSNVLILTPNTRLTRLLAKKQQNELLKLNPESNTALHNNTIVPYKTWLTQQYQSLWNTAKPILTGPQENLLWERIVSDSLKNQSPLLTRQMAQLAQKAYRLVREWQIEIDELDASTLKEHLYFKNWMHLFTEHCEKLDVISENDIANECIEKAELIAKNLPKTIIFYAFEALTPLQRSLYKRLADVDIDIIDKQIISTESSNHDVYRFNELNDEVEAMASWAKNCYEKNPTATITCVIPNLQAVRNHVKRIFIEKFYGTHCFEPDLNPIFNISGGYPLYDASPVYCAVQLLSLNRHAFDLSSLSLLANLPYCEGYFAEMSQRAIWANLIREKYNFPVDLTLPIGREVIYAAPPLLRDSLEKWLDLQQNTQLSQTFSTWRITFKNILSLFGWPGNRTLNSEEFQQIDHFFKILQEFSEMDVTHRAYNHETAIDSLKSLLKSTIFEKKTENESIQVLGLLEAAGLNSDYLWIMNLDNDTLPSKANPNPLLPTPLQKKYNTPHCSAEHEFHYALSMFNDFLQRNKNIVLSYHQYEADHRLSPSPLLAPETIQDYTRPTPDLATNNVHLEYLEDSKAPTLSLDERITGGSTIFKSQAECPFKAFTQHRLHVKEISYQGLIYDHAKRGSVLHEALEIIWATLKSHATLIAYPADSKKNLIRQAAKTALNKIYYLKNQYQLLEQIRLEKLLTHWLSIESSRADFAIAALEEEHKLNFGPLNITLRIDRVDKIADNDYLIIDYKSGQKKSIAGWEGERPQEPQCLLYSMAIPNSTGLSFAHVTSKNPRFVGMASFENTMELKKIEPEVWQEKLNDWHQILKKLAEEFIGGQAAVAPREASVCIHCQFGSLCRIDEHLESTHA